MRTLLSLGGGAHAMGINLAANCVVLCSCQLAVVFGKQSFARSVFGLFSWVRNICRKNKLNKVERKLLLKSRMENLQRMKHAITDSAIDIPNPPATASFTASPY
jgi:hypothetical protein